MMSNDAQGPDNRREHRQRVLKGGSIILGVNESEIACTIRNLHSHGAELRVSPEVMIPSEFLLHIGHDNITWRCEQRWRLRERVGVRFIERAQKPAWHYG